MRRVIPLLAVALAACQQQAPEPQPTTTVTATPTATPSPTPTPGLSRYLGKYPFDKVDGITFLDDPKVVAAVRASGAETRVQELILGGARAADADPQGRRQDRVLGLRGAQLRAA